MNSPTDAAAVAAVAVPAKGPAVSCCRSPARSRTPSSLKAHLLEQIERPGPCEIDGGAVQHVDTAGVQLVLAFTLECLERNVQYTWTSRSPVFEEAVRVLGVGALLECPG